MRAGHYIVLSLSIFACQIAISQPTNIFISGFALDKKNTPIELVNVEYWNNGQVAGEDFTDINGYFEFYALVVNIHENEFSSYSGEELIKAYPNPYFNQCFIEIVASDNSRIGLYGLNGLLFNEIKFERAGKYLLLFKRDDNYNGISILKYQDKHKSKTLKLIGPGESYTEGFLSIISSEFYDSFKSFNRNGGDSITFSHPDIANTGIAASGNDTSFSQILNHSPIITGFIQSVTAEEGDTLEWNIFNHHYNDDLSELTTTSTGASIIGDSTYQFIAPGTGVFQQLVTITDPEDPEMTKYLAWEVYVNQTTIPPIANPDYYTHPEDSGTHIADVTANDNDPDGTIETVEILLQPWNGTSTVNGLNIETDFDEHFNGADSLQYMITDNDGLTDTTWTYYNVTPTNDGPIQTNDIEDQTSLEDIMNTVDLSQYYNHPDGDPITVTNVDNLAAGSTWNQNGDNLEMTPPTDYNTDNSGLMTEVTITAEDPDGDVIVFNGFDWDVTADNDLIIVNEDNYPSVPYNMTTTLDVLANDDDSKDPLGGIDPSTLTIITQPENGNAQVINEQIEYISSISGPDSLEYQVSDQGHPLPPTTGNAWVYMNVEQQQNQPPTINIDDMAVDEDEQTPHTLDDNLNNNATDPNGDDLTYTVISQSNTTLANVEVQQDSLLILTYLQPDSSGTSDIGVEASDGNGGADTAYFTLTVNPLADVTFEAKWLMDTTLIDNATLHIGNDQYTMTNGQLTIQVSPGTEEVNVTHPNSIDNTSIWETYLAIQTPGQNENVEQRAGGDASSPITFGTNDITYNLYKIKNDFDMYFVAQGIGTGPTGETIRFAWDPNNPTAYFDESGTNQTPNATTVQRTQNCIAAIDEATLGKLDMVYDQGSNPPTTPYLELAINPAFSQPTNSTSFNGSYEITAAEAHWLNNGSEHVIWTEMIQAVQNQVDIGQSLTSWNGSTWELSTYGKSCLRFGYMFNPGTNFITPTDNSGNMNKTETFTKPTNGFVTSQSHSNVEFKYE